jgi:hypothetical protein
LFCLFVSNGKCARFEDAGFFCSCSRWAAVLIVGTCFVHVTLRVTRTQVVKQRSAEEQIRCNVTSRAKTHKTNK